MTTRKNVQKGVKEGGVTKKRVVAYQTQPAVSAGYENQSVPILTLRDKEMPFVVLKPGRKVEWHDLDESGQSAVTDENYETILFKDKENIMCLLATKGTPKLKKSDGKDLSREWLYNYSILYISTVPEAEMKEIKYREKEIRNLNRCVTDGTNIKRLVNNGPVFGTWFPQELNHTCDEDEPSHRHLFELKFGPYTRTSIVGFK